MKRLISLRIIYLVLLVIFCNVCYGQQSLSETIPMQIGLYDYKMYYQDQQESLVLLEESKPDYGKDKLLVIHNSFNAAYLHLDMTASGTIYELTMAYDQFRKVYVLTSLDSATSMIDIYQGDFNEKGQLILTNLESGTHYLDAEGVKVFNRIIIDDLNDDGFSMQIDGTKNGGENWFLQAKYEFLKR